MINCYYEQNTSDERFTVYDEETGEYFTIPNPHYQTESIYTAYSSNTDMTFIMKDVCEDTEVISTEVIGWYFGEPNESATEAFVGKLKATF